jgi:hypothetical protein
VGRHAEGEEHESAEEVRGHANRSTTVVAIITHLGERRKVEEARPVPLNAPQDVGACRRRSTVIEPPASSYFAPSRTRERS